MRKDGDSRMMAIGERNTKTELDERRCDYRAGKANQGDYRSGQELEASLCIRNDISSVAPRTKPLDM